VTSIKGLITLKDDGERRNIFDTRIERKSTITERVIGDGT
jgi:hypothetical protein